MHLGRKLFVGLKNSQQCNFFKKWGKFFQKQTVKKLVIPRRYFQNLHLQINQRLWKFQPERPGPSFEVVSKLNRKFGETETTRSFK